MRLIRYLLFEKNIRLHSNFSGFYTRILDLPLAVGNLLVRKASGAPGGTRIMDLDQYLEKMNTNTNVI